MRKDYAKYVSYPKQSRNRLMDLFLVVILLFLVLGLIYAACAHKQGAAAKQQMSQWATNVTTLFSHKKNATGPKAHVGLQQAEKKPTESTVHFDFYTALPAMQVAPSVKSIINKPTIPPVDQYFLQLGTFKNRADAGQARLSLLLAGVDAEVVQAVVGAKTFYHIQQGPYLDKKQVLAAQQKLQQQGIVSIIRKV